MDAKAPNRAIRPDHLARIRRNRRPGRSAGRKAAPVGNGRSPRPGSGPERSRTGKPAPLRIPPICRPEQAGKPALRREYPAQFRLEALRYFRRNFGTDDNSEMGLIHAENSAPARKTTGGLHGSSLPLVISWLRQTRSLEPRPRRRNRSRAGQEKKYNVPGPRYNLVSDGAQFTEAVPPGIWSRPSGRDNQDAPPASLYSTCVLRDALLVLRCTTVNHPEAGPPPRITSVISKKN